MANRAALGKGLGALLGVPQNIPGNNPSATAAAFQERGSNPAAVSEIPMDDIVPNPYQPRTTFDEDALAELSDSIRTLGIIQPLTLRRMPDGKYQIISGERRYRASRMAGLASVPAYVRMADDTAMLEMAIVENIQRENLDAIETALGFQRLIDECDLTQEAMAIRVGKKRATVTNYLRLLRLPPDVQKAVKENLISGGHAKALLAIEDPALQSRLCAQAVKYGWSVRTIEDKIRKALEKPQPRASSEIPPRFSPLVELAGRFNGRISLKDAGGQCNCVTIKFKSGSDLDRFVSATANIKD